MGIGLLNKIGVENKTDKSSLKHGYLSHYEKIISIWCNKEIPTILEIGVLKGASLRTWAEYFKKSLIVGVDINKNSLQYCTDSIKIEIGSQSDINFLESLKKYKPDIIIDDGSHKWSHQIFTLVNLFPFLETGGIYIIEDLQTSGNDFLKKRGKGSISEFSGGAETPAAIILSYIGAYLMADGKPYNSIYEKESKQIDNILKKIDSVYIGHKFIAILKNKRIII